MQARGKEIVKQPKRSASAAAMLQAEKSIAELRQGKADAEVALQVSSGGCTLSGSCLCPCIVIRLVP